MIKSLKKLFERLSGAKSASARVILIGIDYPSHTLGRALQDRGAEITAFIDDEPWNHRTKMLGTCVHYPSEVAALAERYRADTLVRFKGGAIDLPELVQQQLNQLNVNTLEIDAQMLDIETQLDLTLAASNHST